MSVLWQVCEEQSCEEQVFPLSVCLLDRFLCVRAVPRCRLQLLACAALLVASKVKQTSPLSVPLLVAYTDNSITHQELVVSNTHFNPFSNNK
jgi:G1/S-specific cyclin-D2